MVQHTRTTLTEKNMPGYNVYLKFKWQKNLVTKHWDNALLRRNTYVYTLQIYVTY